MVEPDRGHVTAASRYFRVHPIDRVRGTALLLAKAITLSEEERIKQGSAPGRGVGTLAHLADAMQAKALAAELVDDVRPAEAKHYSAKPRASTRNSPSDPNATSIRPSHVRKSPNGLIPTRILAIVFGPPARHRRNSRGSIESSDTANAEGHDESSAFGRHPATEADSTACRQSREPSVDTPGGREYLRNDFPHFSPKRLPCATGTRNRGKSTPAVEQAFVCVT